MANSIHGMDFDGVALYGNPVLDSEPFDESLLDGGGLGVEDIDMMEMGMEPGMEMGPVGAEMPLPDEMGAEMGGGMVPPPEAAPAPNDAQMRGDMLNLLAKKAQARQQASESYQQQAMQLNKQK
jgi:hypothetical protein